MLERCAFRSVGFENADLQQQICVFAHAKRMVSPHGTGLTNNPFHCGGLGVLELNRALDGSAAHRPWPGVDESHVDRALDALDPKRWRCDDGALNPPGERTLARPVDLSAYRDLLAAATAPAANAAPAGAPARDPEIAAIEALLDAAGTDPGAVGQADARIAALIEADPAEAAPWFLHARLLAARGQTVEAREACRRAIALWPDILPVYRLLSDLAPDGASDETPSNADIDTARRVLLAHDPGDASLANRIAAGLCADGRFEAALPYLRQAAPVLGHLDRALWNYTTALAVTGGTHELLAIEPMLAAYAREVPAPFGPFAHLANAKLAHQADRAAVLREIAAREASPHWLDAPRLAEALAGAIAERRAFSVVLLSEAQARLVSYASTRAHRILGEAEMLAVADSVWAGAFGENIESQGAARAATICRHMLSAIAGADVVGLPDGRHLTQAHEHFGFLAEMQRIALQRDGANAGLGVLGELHQAMPYLRPLLANQPFLGFVGCYPDLAERLGRFAQIAETLTIAVPAALNRSDVPEMLRGAASRPEQALADLVVPYPGAIFLVGAGLLGTLYCGRIRELGGIAIDIDPIVTSWMRG